MSIYEVGIGWVPWIIGMGAVAAFAYQAVRKRTTWKRVGVVAVAAFIVAPSIAIVPAGHRGVVYALGSGVSEHERGEGLALLVPWVQHLRPVNVRTQKIHNTEVFSQSRDLQEITVVASVNYRVDPARAAELYRDVGTGYERSVIEPALLQRMKAAVGQVLAVDFAANRSQLAIEVRDQLEDQLAGYGVIIEYVNIEDGIFDPDFIAAVKAKIIADEKAAEETRLIEAERARKAQEILKSEARARAIRIEARAQAKANTRLARTLTSAMIRWRWILAWNGIVPQVVAGEGTKFLIMPPEAAKGAS